MHCRLHVIEITMMMKMIIIIIIIIIIRHYHVSSYFLIRNLAIANRLRVSCAHKVTTVVKRPSNVTQNHWKLAPFDKFICVATGIS